MIGSFFEWWGNSLAALMPTGFRQFFVQEPKILAAHFGDDIHLELISRRSRTHVGDVETISSRKLRRLKERVRRGSVNVAVAVPDDSVGLRQIELPLAAKSELAQVLSFEIDRLTPFERDEIYFAGHISAVDRANNSMTVDVGYVPRAKVDSVVERLKDVGLPPKWAGRLNGKGQRVPPNLLPLPKKRLWTPARVLTGVLFIAAIAMACYAWLQVSERKASTIAALEDELASLRRDAIAEVPEGDGGTTSAALAAHDAKQLSVSIVSLLAQITDLTPDGTSLTVLEFSEGSVLLSGESNDPAALISIFDSADGFASPVFEAPITRGETAGKSRFLLQIDVVGTVK